MQSSGDSRSNGVRQAAWGIFHLQRGEAGCKARTGRGRGRLKGSLVLPAICHLSDVTRRVRAAHFKGPFLFRVWSLLFGGMIAWLSQKSILLCNKKKKKKLEEQPPKLTQL